MRAETRAARARASTYLFAATAAAVFGTALLLARLLPGLRRPDAVAAGLTFDLVVTVPAAFYLLVVRRRGWPAPALVPVVVLGAVAAGRILPPDHRQPLRVVEFLALPLEAGLLGFIGWRAVRALRAARRDAAADPLQQFRRAAFDMLRSDRAAAFVATEFAVLYYAFGAWRARPHAPAGTGAFTQHRRCGHAAIVAAFLLVIAVEGIAAHILVSLWNVPAAWLLTAGSAYAAVWLVADYRATALRPILAGPGGLVIRAGLRANLSMPAGAIAAVDRARPPFGGDVRNLTLLGTPTHWITFDSPVIVEGPYGLRRRVRAVGIAADDPAGLDRALAAARSSRE